jgi:hypothetical protein
MAKSSNTSTLVLCEAQQSAVETLEVLHEAFGEHSLSRTVVFE